MKYIYSYDKIIKMNINERNYPNHPYGKFAFVLKGTNPKNIPKDAEKIEIPFNKA